MGLSILHSKLPKNSISKLPRRHSPENPATSSAESVTLSPPVVKHGGKWRRAQP
jgi:hypothetical protein